MSRLLDVQSNLPMWQTSQKVENDTTLNFFSFKKFFLMPSQKRDFSGNIKPKRENTTTQYKLNCNSLTYQLPFGHTVIMTAI